MTTLQERMAEVFPHPIERGRQAEIAKLCDVKPASVSAWFKNPEKVTTISRTNAEKLCDHFKLKVNPAWLAEGLAPKFSTGEGQMLTRGMESSSSVGGSLSIANTSPGPDIRGRVPLISWVQAGDWCQAEAPMAPGEAERWMDCPVSHSPGTFALRVRGDSMTAPHGNTRTYPEGCFIFVDPERRNPVNGDRVVACLAGTDEATFKIYKHEDGRQWLQPLNPSHEPIREKFTILGAVIGKWEDE